jgi:hypothetical protein
VSFKVVRIGHSSRPRRRAAEEQRIPASVTSCRGRLSAPPTGASTPTASCSGTRSAGNSSSPSALGLPQRLPRCRLHCPPRRALPCRAYRTSRAMFHAGGVEGRSPASVIILSQLPGRSLGGASPRRRAQSRPTTPSTCGEHEGRGRRRASSTRRSPAPL